MALASPSDPHRHTTVTSTTPVTYLDRIRWSDIDAAGIVCYGRYLRFFEGAEEELFRTAGLPTDSMAGEHGVWLVRRRVVAEFTHPVRLGDELCTAAYVIALGHTSIRLGFVAAVDGRLVAEGEYVVVSVDRDTLATRPVPDELRARLAPFVLPGRDAALGALGWDAASAAHGAA